MEKIQERNLKWLWLPQVLIIPALGIAVLFALIPVVGWIFSAVCLLAALGLLGCMWASHYGGFLLWRVGSRVSGLQ